jgi:uncharacterized MnhB-related membrane protein
VTFAAVASMSLIYATPMVSDLLSIALFAFLIAAVLGAMLAVRARRSFWGGCAVAGWFYIATTCIPQHVPMPWVVTSGALSALYPRIYGKSNSTSVPQTNAFYGAGQTLAVFAWSVAGGIMAGRFRRDD